MLRPVVAQRHKCVTVNAIASGFDLHFRKYLFKFILSFPRFGVEPKCGVESLNTRYLQNSTENR